MNNIERIESLMLELEAKDRQLRLHEEMLRTVADSLAIAVWAKDIDNCFVYVNKTGCDRILHCTEKEAISLRDTDFENDVLALMCIKSDNIVRADLKTMRFVEHARYPDGGECLARYD